MRQVKLTVSWLTDKLQESPLVPLRGYLVY